jgi:hypothetical protein
MYPVARLGEERERDGRAKLQKREREGKETGGKLVDGELVQAAPGVDSFSQSF